MEKQILYKYSKLELEQFAIFENHYNPEVAEIQFETEVQFSFDRQNNILCCKVTVNMAQHELLVCKAVMNSYFTVEPDSVKNLKKDGSIVFSPALLVQFSSLCYGSLRGAIYVKIMGTPLSSCVLPPLYFNKIIDKPFVC